jgi:hypothetical protein
MNTADELVDEEMEIETDDDSMDEEASVDFDTTSTDLDYVNEYNNSNISKSLKDTRNNVGLTNFLKARQIGYKSMYLISNIYQGNQLSSEFIAKKQFPLYTEREFDTTGIDKIFASVWLNSKAVILGSKCNKLLLLNVDSGCKLEIPALELAKEQEEVSSAHVGDTTNQFARRFSTTSDSSISSGPSTWNKTKCFGIHSLSINPSRTMLAVG